MKVYIGKYRNYWGPYQIASFILAPLTWFKPRRKSELDQALETGESDEHGELCHKFGEFLAHGSIKKKGDIWRLNNDRPITWLYKLCNWIKSKKNRKIKVHIDSWDTWNMDNTLAIIIVPMLKQLKETNHGTPFTDDEDVPEELRSTSATPKENDWDIDDNHFKRWDWIIDEMIWAFEQELSDDSENQFYSGEADYFFEKVKDSNLSVFEMKEGEKHSFKIDTEGLENHHKRMKNGFRLFGKYYQALWD